MDCTTVYQGVLGTEVKIGKEMNLIGSFPIGVNEPWKYMKQCSDMVRASIHHFCSSMETGCEGSQGRGRKTSKRPLLYSR